MVGGNGYDTTADNTGHRVSFQRINILVQRYDKCLNCKRIMWKIRRTAVQLKYASLFSQLKIKINANVMHCKLLFDRPSRFSERFLGAFAKLRKATVSFVMCVCLPVCLHGTTRLSLDGFS